MHGRTIFLINLVKKHGLKCGAELGIWDARNTAPLLEHCPELYMIGVDAWLPIFEGFRNWDHVKYELVARQRLEPFGDRITIINDVTRRVVAKIKDESLDFIFVDACHVYEYVLEDIRLWSPKVRAGGWITGHDIDFESVLKAVREEAPASGYKTAKDNVWYWRKT